MELIAAVEREDTDGVNDEDDNASVKSEDEGDNGHVTFATSPQVLPPASAAPETRAAGKPERKAKDGSAGVASPHGLPPAARDLLGSSEGRERYSASDAVKASRPDGPKRGESKSEVLRRRSLLSADDLKYHTEEELTRYTMPPDDYVLFHSAPSSIIVTTASGVIVMANSYCHKMLGYEEGELVGRAVEIVMPKEYRDGHVGMMECVPAVPRVARRGANTCARRRHRRVTVQHGVPRLLGHGGRQVPAVRKNGTSLPVLMALNSFVHDRATFVVACFADLSSKCEPYEATIASEVRQDAKSVGGTRSRARVVMALVVVALLRVIVFGLSAFSLSTAVDRVAVVIGAQQLRFDAAMVAFDARELALSNLTGSTPRERLVNEVSDMLQTRTLVRFGPPPASYRFVSDCVCVCVFVYTCISRSVRLSLCLWVNVCSACRECCVSYVCVATPLCYT